MLKCAGMLLEAFTQYDSPTSDWTRILGTLCENEWPVLSTMEPFESSPAAPSTPARVERPATRAGPDRESGGGRDHVVQPASGEEREREGEG